MTIAKSKDEDALVHHEMSHSCDPAILVGRSVSRHHGRNSF